MKSKSEGATHKPDANRTGPRALWALALVLLVLALGLSSELVRLHIEATSNAEYHSYCSVNATVSCDTVTRSQYALVFGVPLAVWGVLGYTLMALIAVLSLKRGSRAHAALFASFAAFNVAVTLALAAVSPFLIHAWCLVCVGTYVVNIAVAFIAYALLRREGVRACYGALIQQIREHSARSFAALAIPAGVALTLVLLYPPVQQLPALETQEAESSSAAPAATAPAASGRETIPPLPPDAQIETGVTEEGLPWIGSANPVVTITEFFDYECSHCRQAFHGMHQLLALNPDRLRLVVRHFPLNPECNRFISRPIYRHSCFYAKLANCAKEQHQFWQAHEYLFDRSAAGVESAAFAEALSLDTPKLEACLKRDNPELNRDIEAGIALELHGTPVFVIDGQVYMQSLPRLLASKLRNPPGW